jgi:hypothetical protein
MSCPVCEQRKRHERLVERELADLREVTQYSLSSEERREIEAEERLLQDLLDRIVAEQLASA